MKLTREFYTATIPQHAQKITVKVDGSVIYKWAADGKILLKAFKGKSAKPSFYYSYKNDEAANKKISDWIESLRIMSGNCLPIPGKFIGAEKKCRVQYGTRIKVSKCAHASLLDFTEIAGMKIFKSTGFSCYA